MAGNSVILRPSPLTPISSLVFGAAAEAAGLRAGALSVVVEPGAAGAELLTTDPAVDMVSFTGSTVVGRQILGQAAPTVKRVALELGGKSAQIYLPDAVPRVAAGTAQVVAMTAGQAGVAATRMLVPQEQKDQVLEAVSAAYAGIKGGPADGSRGADGSGDQRRPTGALRAVRGPGRGARRQDRARRWSAGGPRKGVLLRADHPGFSR
jgi:acyl-CoA reductase-like NAD-dependent aldehyde dehydrogenase